MRSHGQFQYQSPRESSFLRFPSLDVHFRNARSTCLRTVAHIRDTDSSAPHELLYLAALVVG